MRASQERSAVEEWIETTTKMPRRSPARKEPSGPGIGSVFLFIFTLTVAASSAILLIKHFVK